MISPEQLTIHEAHMLLKSRQLSSVELTKAVLARIESIDPKIRAFVTVTAEKALRQAEQADKRIASGDCHPLTGIPAVVKDLLCTKDIRTTCSSKMLENFVPPYNATVIEKLYAEGMVLVGKANMDECAMGSSTENSTFFTTHNPWDVARVPGGSSGGAAAAVAAREGFYALGSDTGGSIRQPASFCSITGLKPTYGRISRYGLIALASSLDQIGPMTQDVEDAAIVMNAISGYDDHDPSSVACDVPDYSAALDKGIKGMRLGIPREYFAGSIQSEVASTIKTAIAKMEELGACIDWDVNLPNTPYAPAAYSVIASAEASANLARYDGIRYGFSYQGAQNMWETIEKTRQFGFGPEVKQRAILGTYVLSDRNYDTYFVKAQKVRTLIKQDFDKAFEKYDALITPTSPIIPFKIGEKPSDLSGVSLSDIYTTPINLAGIPAISIPAGFAGNAPIGLQIIAKPFAEKTIFRIAHAYEQATDWQKHKPAF